MQAVQQAINKIDQERAMPLFLAQDYHLLKNANPTDKKGNPNSMQKNKLNRQAEKLFNMVTTGKEKIEKPVVKLTAEQEEQILKELVQVLPKYKKQG